MQVSDDCVLRFKRLEKFKSKKYLCPAGKPTIGYGHVILEHEVFTEITEPQGEEILRNDIKKAERSVNKYVTVTLNQNQYDALVLLAFNIGGEAFRASTLRRKLNYGDYDWAAKEFTRWTYAGGVSLNGLVTRRKEEQALFKKPV